MHDAQLHLGLGLRQEELTLLLSGIDLSQIERKRWYRAAPSGEESSTASAPGA